jgi:putative oxidoreductase
MDEDQKAPFAAGLETYAYAALRIVAGALFAFHGAQKILGWHATSAAPAVGSQIWFGGLIELFGGSLIALGLFARGAAFLASGTMAVAYFQFHWKFALANAMWAPAINKGELAVVYCFVFLFIAARGSGSASLDALRRAGRS